MDWNSFSESQRKFLLIKMIEKWFENMNFLLWLQWFCNLDFSQWMNVFLVESNVSICLFNRWVRQLATVRFLYEPSLCQYRGDQPQWHANHMSVGPDTFIALCRFSTENLHHATWWQIATLCTKHEMTVNKHKQMQPRGNNDSFLTVDLFAPL